MIKMDGLLAALEPQPVRTGKRGRRRNSGRHDMGSLLAMAELIAAGKAPTPTEAARQINGPGDSNGVRRRVGKFNKMPGLLAKANEWREKHRLEDVARIQRESQSDVFCFALMADQSTPKECEWAFRMGLRVGDWAWKQPEVRKAYKHVIAKTRAVREATQLHKRWASIEQLMNAASFS